MLALARVNSTVVRFSFVLHMKSGLLVLLLLTQTTGSRQPVQAVTISVVAQKQFRNRGHHPENNRRVIFRLANTSSVPVIIYGFEFANGFDPTGYLMALNETSGGWEYPNSQNRPTAWTEVAPEFKSQRILRPGESVTFVSELSHFEVGTHFRRTVYVAHDKSDVPFEVRGTEFVLK